MKTKLLVFCFVLTPLSLIVNTPSPELNPAGKRRLEENRQILSKSIEISETNLRNSEQNINTLDQELASISKIENKFSKLKGQYEAFLQKAQTETEKNNRAIKRLNNNPQSKMAPVELAERELWAKNTAIKVEKVRGLLQSINRKLAQVQSQRKDVETQKLHWVGRKKVHEGTLEELAGKKSSTEKLLRGEG